MTQTHRKCSGIGEANTKKVFAGILSALEFMHDEHLVHRNLKAENILIFDVNDFSKVLYSLFNWEMRLFR